VSIIGFAFLALAGWLLPSALVAFGAAAAFCVAGFGGGLVVSSNQTLMLQEVPLKFSSIAGSLGQVSQRTGTTFGAAAVLSAFYTAQNYYSGTVTSVDAMKMAFLFGMV